MNKEISNTTRVPLELERGLTRPVRELADARIVFPVGLFMYAVLVLLAYKAHSAWVYFIPPPLGSLLGSCILVAQPYNPYNNFFASLEGRRPADINADPAAQRLLTLLTSNEARRIVIRTGLLQAISFSILMLLIMSIQPKPFVSKTEPVDLVFNTFGFWVASFYIQLHYLLSWSFRQWRIP